MIILCYLIEFMYFALSVLLKQALKHLLQCASFTSKKVEYFFKKEKSLHIFSPKSQTWNDHLGVSYKTITLFPIEGSKVIPEVIKACILSTNNWIKFPSLN